MKTKHLLMTLLLALAVPLAALAQVERTVTDGPTSTVETNQTRAITDNNSPIHIRYANFVTTNSAWIVFDCDLEYNFHVNNVYSGQYYIRYKTESMSNWSEERSFSVQYNGGTPYCNFAYVCSITPYTRYTVQIRCFINNAYCEWSDEFSFATLCPVTATPYNIDFNGLSALPQYWRVETGTGNACSVANDQLSVSTTSGNPLDAYVILPYFENLATLQLSFNATRTAGSCNEMQVGIMTDPFDANTFSPLQTLTLSEATTTYGSSLLEASTQHGHIAIKLNDATEEQHSVWFDDFAVTRLQALDNLAVNVTNSSATLSWTTIAPSVQIQYREADGTWSGSITPEGNPYTITGLTENTNYEARIRANFTTFNSDWVSFGTFKTLMQEAVVMNAENASYYEDFESGNGNWMFIDGGGEVNRWRRFSYFSINDGNLGYGLRVTYSADNSATTQWKYRTGYEYSFGNTSGFMATPATSYAVKTFNLSAGHYEFDYRYAVKGRANDDYMRVVLVPAETVLVNGTLPSGFDYANTPAGWFSLDGGGQLTGSSSYAWRTKSTVTLDVYPGGTYEPGNYMIVVLWKNDGSSRFDLAQNPPGAIDNVSVTWSPVIYAPSMAQQGTTDSEATLSLIAPGSGITPTSYEVQYISEADYANNNNQYGDAPIATFNVTETTQTVTLTGLMPMTSYAVRVRSVFTANGHSVYSDWQDYGPFFTTKCPRPTNLTVVNQTTSWANVMWTPVEMTLPSSQSIRYEYQLTTDQNNWDVPIISTNFGNNSCSQNFAPGTYYIRVRTYVEEYTGSALLRMGESDWTEPITFTIAPWTDPVSIFPLAYGFDEGLNRFADGITLGGDITLLNIVGYDDHELPIHGGGASTSTLAFGSDSPCESHLVLPPLNPSTSDALVSFWWYHDNAETDTNVGVVVEYSNDGSTWQSNNPKITRYADETGWAKYQQVVPAIGSNATYVRLRFVGPSSYRPWAYCFLDDLTVTTFKSEQPYISYVGCDAYTATITLYDYAYQNGWPSSAFHVQYRKVGQDTWIDYADFVNQAPYAFENSLDINGLDPNSYYEFRACARVSYNGNDFAWSNYCEPYRQWTSNDVFTVTPTHPYEHDFEFGAYNWTEGSWNTQYEGGYNSSYCAYMSSASVSTLATPEIHFDESCDNVIIRFRVKGSGRFSVYYGENYAQSTVVNTIPSKSNWTKVEYSLSKYMANGTVKIAFGNDYSTNTPVAMFVDDIEIVANAYNKVFDCQPGFPQQWSNANYWYPHAVPTADEDVMIMGYARVGNDDGSNPYIAQAGNVGFGSYGYVQVYPGSTLEAEKVNVATTSSVMISDGGQLKLDSGRPYITMYKRFIGYNDINDDDHFYLFAPSLSGWTSNPSGFTTGEYDLYRFDGENGGAEWRNYKQNTFLMQRGKGYLYAHAKPTTGTLDYTSVTMGGYVLPLGEETISGLVYGTNTDEQPFLNWNLVGNPFPCNAYLSGNRQFYRLVETAEGSRIVLATDNVIKPMEGVFVQAETETESSVTFTTAPTRESGMNFTLSKKSQTRGAESVMADRVRIAIGEGRDLGHLDLMADANRLYIPLNGKDMAVMHSRPVGELPLNFEAAENGTYTIGFENATEGLVYCHLIDNMTGADVDLLATSTGSVAEYTFTAKTTDYASRFKVVFASVCGDANGDSETFAFNNNGNWIILNEGRATLQVIDLNGRILSSEQIEGSVQTQINQPSGLYLIRLLNGDDVKVQKVVVR